MAESGEASKPWSNGTRSAALIAAMLPVAAGIFQEAQQARTRRADDLHQQQVLREQAQRDAGRLDQEAAKVLLSAFVDVPSETRGGSADTAMTAESFCVRLQLAAAQLTDQKLTPQTHAVLIAALKLVNRKGDRKVCDCADEGEARAIWFDALKENIERTTDVKSSAALIQEVRTTEDACADNSAPPPAPLIVGGAAVVPVPIPVPPPSAPPVDCRIDASGFSERIRVFVQVPDDGARADAAAFLARVNAARPFKAPGVEVVGLDRSPKTLEIRYAYDQDRPAAEALQKALTGTCQTSGSEPLIRQIAQYQGRVDPRVLEVWWPKPPIPTPSKDTP